MFTVALVKSFEWDAEGTKGLLEEMGGFPDVIIAVRHPETLVLGI